MNIKYTLIESKRKSIAIVIKDDGEVLVKTPKHLSKNMLNNFLNEKEKWVTETLEKVNKRKKEVKKDFKENEKFLYLGSFFELKFIEEKRKPEIIFKNNHFYINENAESPKKLFLNFYKKQAKEILKQRTEFYSKMYNFNIKNLRITSANTRWGSCSSRGNVNLNWKLIMAPLDIIDYVIIHELTHLIHHNHSKNFWNKVEELMPHYKEKRTWLKNNGYILNII